MHFVAKFGGTSLATPERVRAVIDIIRADPRRRYVVVSAPGRRWGGDMKITELLLENKTLAERRASMDAVLNRMLFFTAKLQSSPELILAMEKDFAGMRNAPTTLQEMELHEPRTSALGEKWFAQIFAEAIGWDYADAGTYLRFDSNGVYDPLATERAFEECPLPPRAVIPGFYGSDPQRNIVTFPRNGSDISGAIVAQYTGASLYENWTDTDGVLMAHPGIVPDARTVPVITRTELQELAFRGASVLHGDALFPLMGTDIDVQVRNSMKPSGKSTLVVADATGRRSLNLSVIGIAGRTGFTLVQLAKLGMNNDVGFLARLCSIFASNEVSIELVPGSINTQSVIFADLTEEEVLKGKEEAICKSIKRVCAPDSIAFNRSELALICIVGETMAHQHGVAARALTALAERHINVRVLDQGGSEISIIIGVATCDYEEAVRALYEVFNAQ